MEVQQAESADHYEFDAPSHVIDFKAMDTEDDADQWFDLMSAPTDGGAMGQLTTPLRVDKPFGGPPKGDKPKAIVSPMVKGATTSLDVDNTTRATASNIVMSWGDSRPTGTTQTQRRSAQPRRVPVRQSVRNQGAAAPATPPAKKQRRTVPAPKTTDNQRRSSLSRPLRRSGARSSVRLNPKPTAATTKAPVAAASSTAQPMSTEQQEMERIQALQKKVADSRRNNEASYRAALAGCQLPKRQVLSTTVPKEFNFCSDGRLKAEAVATESSYKEVDFTSQLRKHPSSPAKAPRGTTITQPFNLSRGNKRKMDAGTYVPMAQQIEQFQRRTPTRYHLRSRQSQERGPSPVKVGRTTVTQPHTPQLMTRQRSRPVTVKSTAEMEAEDLEKMQQFKFKALELNRKILKAALVPKKPAAKEATRPEGFQLELERRLQERQASKKPEQPEEYVFRSRPLPVRILEEVVGVPEKKVLCNTVPESPAFALKNRVRVERKTEEVKPPTMIKALSVPHFLPFQPKLPMKSQVEMCPFSFDERERERRVLKEKKLEELRHGEVPKFKAQPLPDFHDVILPEKVVAEPTKLEPFKMLIDERGAAKSDRWEQMMKEELKRQAEAASFKARPNTVTDKEPFMPKKENRSILGVSTNSVVPECFQLSTERRAEERLEFERGVSEKEALRAVMEEEQLHEREEREKEELARLRLDQVHKAQPIRRYKMLELKRSDTSLTVPQSPNFSDRFRM